MITQMMSRNRRDLIRPKAIHLEADSSNEFYGKFTCEPLERGFGITIGNSLRRLLLSSLLIIVLDVLLIKTIFFIFPQSAL